MTEQQESGQAVAERDANPELAQSDVKPNSEAAGLVEGSPSELAKKFEETRKTLTSKVDKLSKQQQIDKDRGMARLQKQIDQLQESVVALHTIGDANSQSSSRGNAENDGTAQDVKDIFEKVLGVENVENTQEFIDFMNTSGNLQGAEKVASAAKFAISRSKPKTQVSQAAIAQPPGGGAKEPDLQSKIQDYTKEMVAARGKPSELKAIKSRYKKEGVDVDNIGFSF